MELARRRTHHVRELGAQWRLGDFYANLRWPGWQDEIAALRLDQGLAVYPPLFTAEGRNINDASRRPVPFAELLAMHAHVADQLAELPPGAPFRLKVSDDPEHA